MAWQQASLEGSNEKAGASGIAVYMLEKDGCMRCGMSVDFALLSERWEALHRQRSISLAPADQGTGAGAGTNKSDNKRQTGSGDKLVHSRPERNGLSCTERITITITIIRRWLAGLLAGLYGPDDRDAKMMSELRCDTIQTGSLARDCPSSDPLLSSPPLLII